MNSTVKSINHIELIDTTLRDGLQSPGIFLTTDQKVRVVHMLSDAGISRFEAGIPASGELDQRCISTLKDTFANLTFIAWCRASIKDIQSAAQFRYDAVHISFPVSPLHIRIPGFTEDQILELLADCVRFARPLFKEVSIGTQDASRADPDFLARFIEHASGFSIDRIRIADTVGILSPSSTSKLITFCKKHSGNIPLEFHAHNDLGMATANTVSAFERGAEFADVTINGIGERAGNAALEEVAIALSIASEFTHSIDTTKLVEICTEFASMTAQSILPMKPVTGKNLFCHESGIHTHGLLKDRSAYEPYPAALTGHEPTQFIGGVQSGAAGIKHILHSHGISFTDNEIKTFVMHLKEQSAALRRTFSDEEVCGLYGNFSKTQIA